MKRRTIVIFACFFLITAYGPVQAKEFKVGLALPLSGVMAKPGDSFKKGFALAFEEIQASGMLKDKNIDLTYVIEDSQCNPEPAVKAVEKMIMQDKVDIVFGEFCSSATLAVSAAAKRYQIPLVIYGGTVDEATDKGHRWVIRPIPNNGQSAGALADLVKKRFQGAKIVTLYPITDFGIDSERIVYDDLGRAGFTVIDRLGVKVEETNFYPLLTRMKGLKPDVVPFFLYGAPVPAMLRQAAEVGFKTQWITMHQPIYEDEAGPLAYGVIRSYFFYATPENQKAMEFDRKVKAKYNRSPDTFMSEAYDTTYFVANALKRAGAEREALLKALRETKDFIGVIGTFSIDEKGQSQGKGRITYVEMQEGGSKYIGRY